MTQATVESRAGERSQGANMNRFTIVGKTIADGSSYPTVAAAMFLVELLRVELPSQEGGTATVTGIGTEFAANLGSAVPPEGTVVALGKALSGRTVFEFNG